MNQVQACHLSTSRCKISSFFMLLKPRFVFALALHGFAQLVLQLSFSLFCLQMLRGSRVLPLEGSPNVTFARAPFQGSGSHQGWFSLLVRRLRGLIS